MIGPILYDPATPVRVEIAAGVNRWSYTVRQGTSVNSVVHSYGSVTEQFTELAELWSTYSNRGVMVEMTPNLAGAGM